MNSGTSIGKSIKVVIATDFVLLGDGIETDLKSMQDIIVVNRATDLVETFQSIDAFMPEIIVIDFDIFAIEDIEKVMDYIVYNRMSLKVLLLTCGRFDEEGILQLLSLGVSGFLPRWTSSQDIIKAIYAVNSGEIWLERRIMGKYVARYLNHKIAVTKVMSGREQEIASLISLGCSNKEIARRLFLSEKTIKTHVTSIFRKMEVDSRLKVALKFSHNNYAKRP